MTQIGEALDQITDRIRQAALRAKRDPAEITLVGASKKVPLERIQEAEARGLRVFGENRVQEGITKFQSSAFIKKIDSLHFLGPLQRNKVRKAVGLFDIIHSVDSLPLAEKINREAANQSKIQSVLIAVNIAQEESKHGISPMDVPAIVEKVRKLKHLSLLGLMAIPPYSPDPEDARRYFKTLRKIAQPLKRLRLSMGMSSDFEVAIEEGATWVRIGRALFGER